MAIGGMGVRRADAFLSALMDRFGSACCYCGERVYRFAERPPFRGSVATVEHIVPRIRGGDDSDDNLVLACTSCNSSKANRLPLEWVLVRERMWIQCGEHFGPIRFKLAPEGSAR